MESESGVSQSIIDEFHSWDMEGIQIDGESAATRYIIDELYSLNIQGDQM